MKTENKTETTTPPAQADFQLTNQGNVWLFQPLTEAAHEWLKEHCPLDGEHQYFCGALVVEWRYVGDIQARAEDAGLTCGV